MAADICNRIRGPQTYAVPNVIVQSSDTYNALRGSVWPSSTYAPNFITVAADTCNRTRGPQTYAGPKHDCRVPRHLQLTKLQYPQVNLQRRKNTCSSNTGSSSGSGGNLVRQRA